MDEMDEPEQPSPSGEPPVRWPWPEDRLPVLRVRIDGRWVHSQVLARWEYPDGRTAFQVNVIPPRGGGGHERMYYWPQEGRLRLAWVKNAPPP